jgi:hypothetical protein
MDLRAWLEGGKRPPSAPPATPSPAKQAKTDAPEVAPTSNASAKEARAKALLATDEFKDQTLKLKGVQVKCRACDATFEGKAHLLRQHCFRSQNANGRELFEKLPEEEKLALRHYERMLARQQWLERGEVSPSLTRFSWRRCRMWKSWTDSTGFAKERRLLRARRLRFVASRE